MVSIFLFVFGVWSSPSPSRVGSSTHRRTSLTDEAYRSEFIGEILEEMRRSLAVRAVYLGALKTRAATAAA